MKRVFDMMGPSPLTYEGTVKVIRETPHLLELNVDASRRDLEKMEEEALKVRRGRAEKGDYHATVTVEQKQRGWMFKVEGAGSPWQRDEEKKYGFPTESKAMAAGMAVATDYVEKRHAKRMAGLRTFIADLTETA